MKGETIQNYVKGKRRGMSVYFQHNKFPTPFNFAHLEQIDLFHINPQENSEKIPTKRKRLKGPEILLCNQLQKNNKSCQQSVKSFKQLWKIAKRQWKTLNGNNFPHVFCSLCRILIEFSFSSWNSLFKVEFF